MKYGRRLALLIATLASAASIAPALVQGAAAPAKPQRVLTVCADPNNLPFSNRAGEGFENELTQRLARELGAQIRYVWWAQRRGYVRNTLNEAKCDLWPGVASGVAKIATTRPYYRSTYMFVTRADRALSGLTLDDARLKSLTIGVQMVGDNAMNTPPAHALARRGLVDNVRGFMLYGDYNRPNPPAAIIDAVALGKIDVALVWGPLAGYFAHRSKIELRLERVLPEVDDRYWPMVYDISVGVRSADTDLFAAVDSLLERDRSAVAALLAEYDVPTLSILGNPRRQTPSDQP